MRTKTFKQCGTQTSLCLVYGHFLSLKTISRRSENHKFSRGRFFFVRSWKSTTRAAECRSALGCARFRSVGVACQSFFASLFLFLGEFASFTARPRACGRSHPPRPTPPPARGCALGAATVVAAAAAVVASATISKGR